MAGAAAGLPPLPAVVRNEPAAVTEARLKWFREARFGIFIHWGVYAVPARGEWYMNSGKAPVATYREILRCSLLCKALF
jgi:alpha-L-fucosidase